MARIETGEASKRELVIDQTFGAARISARPLDLAGGGKPGGHFRAAFRSGAITGVGVTAGAPLFSMRWTSRDMVFVLLGLEAMLTPVVAFTAAQELGLDLMRLTGFSVADSAGTAIALAEGKNRVERFDMAESEIADARIADATLLTAGTATADGYPIAIGSGFVNDANVAAGTELLRPITPYGFSYKPDVINGEHPIVLRQNEGLRVRNLVGFPAAGTVRLHVTLRWAERAASYR